MPLEPRESRVTLDGLETPVPLEPRVLMELETPEPPVTPELREMLVPLVPLECLEPRESLECLDDL